MCYGDVKLCVDTNGVKYLEWDKERGSKTRTGEKSNAHQRAFNPRAYETGADQCPVKMFQFFTEKRPEGSKKDDSPFFLAMIPEQHLSSSKQWYFNRPLGKNLLGEFFK